MKKFLLIVVTMYWLLFCALTPFIIVVLSVIPYIITDNELWMVLLLLTVPIGFTVGTITLSDNFMNKYNYIN